MSATTARPARRTQRERSAATTSALLAAARDRFAALGYTATTLDDIAAHAGMTKGAVYHHFAGKEELFAAVFDREQRAVTAAAAAAAERHAAPWSRVEAVCAAVLAASLEPGTQRITLLDAPLALSATTLRSTPVLALLERTIAAAGRDRHDVGALAQLLHGAVREAALVLAADPARRAATERELGRLVGALAYSEYERAATA